MVEKGIIPQSITKPIQLLGAWLLGLTVVNGTLLSTAVAVGSSWERSALVLAAIADIPLFLTAIFILQTRFRPELQEDSFYADYISRKNESVITVSKIDLLEARIDTVHQEIQKILKIEERENIDSSAEIDWSKWRVAVNDHLPFFLELMKSFKDAKIPIYEIFGKRANAPPLEKYRLIINEEMDSRHVFPIVISKFLLKVLNFGPRFTMPVRPRTYTLATMALSRLISRLLRTYGRQSLKRQIQLI